MLKRPLDYEKTFGDSGQRRQTSVVSSYPLPGWSLLLTTFPYLSLLVSTCHYLLLLITTCLSCHYLLTSHTCFSLSLLFTPCQLSLLSPLLLVTTTTCPWSLLLLGVWVIFCTAFDKIRRNKSFAPDRPCSSSTHEADYELQAAPLKMKTSRMEG